MKALYVLRYFQITDDQLEYLREKGMPCTKRGHHYDYDVEEIEEWAKENAPVILKRDTKVWVGRNEFCELLGVGRDYLRVLLDQGVPHLKLHRNKFLYNMEDITEWMGLPRMDKHEVGSLLTKGDIMDEYQINEYTYHYWLKMGMPKYKFSKKVLKFDLELVENWINGGMKNDN